MKKSLIVLGLFGLILIGGLYAKRKYYDPKERLDNAKIEIKNLADKDEIKNGDLIFQTSLSGQSKAIQLATKSKYSHCGLIFKDGNDFFVFEALQPVKHTPKSECLDLSIQLTFVQASKFQNYKYHQPIK